MKKQICIYFFLVGLLFSFEANAKEIILIRHAKVNLNTKGWMLAKKAHDLKFAYDTASVYAFSPDTVLAKLPAIKADTIFTSCLFRSQSTAYTLFGEEKIFVSVAFLDEFDLHILRLPLLLPYKGWTGFSRFSWIIGVKRKQAETHREARHRVKQATAFIEEKSKYSEQVVLVTHGFINRNLKNSLKKKGWSIKSNNGKKNLGATILEK